MASLSNQRRHEPLSVIEDYFARGISGAISVPGTPQASIMLDPLHATLGIRCPAGSGAPRLRDFQNIRFESVLDGTQLVDELLVTLNDNTQEVYAWLCSILDRVQLAKEPFALAIEGAVDSLSDLTILRHGLTKNQCVGLFGELLVLLALADNMSSGEAVSAWRGPLGEEHDFGIRKDDLEIKSTMSERREHWITGVSQLLPTGSRRLFLVSIQLTLAGESSGSSLPVLVQHARSVFHDNLKLLDRLLREVGYRDSDADLYAMRWALRTPPRFYEVVDEFPAITQSMLDKALSSSDKIVDVRYRVDLTGIPPSPPLFDIREFDSTGVQYEH